LSSSLVLPTPLDNPALHQGRVRAVPHVEGQYATYVYVPLVLHRHHPLYALLEGALSSAIPQVPSLHPIGKKEHDGTKSARWELHISLSHPLFLRAHQREEFKRAIRQLASSVAPFDASFTTFSELANDERTRAFLAMQVGAGHAELRRCLDLLTPTLRLLRQKEFYADPRFHASIAWTLLEKTPSSSVTASLSIPGEPAEIALPQSTASEEHRAQTAYPGVTEQPSDLFHRIPHFPHTLLSSLNKAYATKLSRARTGGFIVDSISVKIGKDIFTWPINGTK